jgi:hypothetical protein
LGLGSATRTRRCADGIQERGCSEDSMQERVCSERGVMRRERGCSEDCKRGGVVRMAITRGTVVRMACSERSCSERGVMRREGGCSERCVGARGGGSGGASGPVRSAWCSGLGEMSEVRAHTLVRFRAPPGVRGWSVRGCLGGKIYTIL